MTAITTLPLESCKHPYLIMQQQVPNKDNILVVFVAPGHEYCGNVRPPNYLKQGGIQKIIQLPLPNLRSLQDDMIKRFEVKQRPQMLIEQKKTDEKVQLSTEQKEDTFQRMQARELRMQERELRMKARAAEIAALQKQMADQKSSGSDQKLALASK